MDMILGVLLMIGLPALGFYIFFSVLDKKEEEKYNNVVSAKTERAS